MKKIVSIIAAMTLAAGLVSCGTRADAAAETEQTEIAEDAQDVQDAAAEAEGEIAEDAQDAQGSMTEASADVTAEGLPAAEPGKAASGLSEYVDSNGESATIPAGFVVSKEKDEQVINEGLVVIGPDGSEYVWIPTTVTELAQRDFGAFFSGGDSISNYYDETDLPEYRAMADSVDRFGGFYFSRYEISRSENDLPASRQVTDGKPYKIWTNFSPQDATEICAKLYADNDTVQGFFPWGSNWDTVLQWLIDTGNKEPAQISSDSSGWGNYANDSFSVNANNRSTGIWEEAEANNICDLAGNNWEWTQERCGSSYVMRGGGCTLMGGGCNGNDYPAAVRDPLPGNNHHPNVVVRAGLFIK